MMGIADSYYTPQDPPVYVGSGFLTVERDWPFVGEDAELMLVGVDVSQDKRENFSATIAEIDSVSVDGVEIPAVSVRNGGEIELIGWEMDEAIREIAEASW